MNDIQDLEDQIARRLLEKHMIELPSSTTDPVVAALREELAAKDATVEKLKSQLDSQGTMTEKFKSVLADRDKLLASNASLNAQLADASAKASEQAKAAADAAEELAALKVELEFLQVCAGIALRAHDRRPARASQPALPCTPPPPRRRSPMQTYV